MSTPISDPNHPLWDCIKYTVFIAALTTVLWVNASDFDATEIKSVLTMLAVMGGWGGVEQIMKYRKKHTQEMTDGTL